jgi:hypothetical protein
LRATEIRVFTCHHQATGRKGVERSCRACILPLEVKANTAKIAKARLKHVKGAK